MKNADMPAYPTIVAFDEDGVREFQCGTSSFYYFGRTKREAFVMAAMQGLCASGRALPAEAIAATSKTVADATLAELEK